MGWDEARYELSGRNGESDVENTGLKGNESKWTWETWKELWQRQKKRSRKIKVFLDENITKGLKFS